MAGRVVDSGLNWFYVFCNMLTLSGYRLYGRSVILCRSLYILFFFCVPWRRGSSKIPQQQRQCKQPFLCSSHHLTKTKKTVNKTKSNCMKNAFGILSCNQKNVWLGGLGPGQKCCCACHSACLTIRPNASWPKWQFD